ncbi:MAG TPA: TIR domain-containing protein [Casimicrobiaceae bacterium]
MLDATRQRVFLTFAAGDLVQARPVTARLLAGGGIALDHGLTSEPFAGERGDFIRASLLARLRHCTSLLCLYGSRTLEDDWVRWSLQSAAELRLPLLGASLPGPVAYESERGLAGLGVEIVPLDREAILTKARWAASHRPARTLDAASIVETLHLMRRPLR